MASTFLVRLKVGPKLVDAKGVNKLYRELGPAARPHRCIVAAALVAVTVIIMISSDPLVPGLLVLLPAVRAWLGL